MPIRKIAKPSWIPSPVTLFLLFSGALGGLVFALLPLVLNNDSEDLAPGVRIVTALASLLYVSWLVMLAPCALPRLLGQMLVARASGVRLSHITLWPIHIELQPRPQASIIWRAAYFSRPRTWRPDGEYVPAIQARVILGGFFLNLLVAAILLVASRLVEDRDLGGWLFLLGLMSLFSGLFSFFPDSGDRAMFTRMKSSPDEMDGDNALHQIRSLVLGKVPPTGWPMGLAERALSKNTHYANRIRVHLLLLTSLCQMSDREGIILRIESSLKDFESWPSSRMHYAKEFKIRAAQAYTLYLARPDLARKMLPSQIGLPLPTAVSRHLVLAQIIAHERGVAAGRKAVAAAEITLKKLSRASRRQIDHELKYTKALMESWESITPADDEVLKAWSNRVRPREWDRDSMMQITNRIAPAKMWAFRAMARLTYWNDVGDLSQMDAIVKEVEARPLNLYADFEQSQLQRLWCEVCLHYALNKSEPVPAQSALKTAESAKTSNCRVLLAAQAAVLALENRMVEAQAKLDDLHALLDSLPDWDTYWPEEQDRIARIKSVISR